MEGEKNSNVAVETGEAAAPTKSALKKLARDQKKAEMKAAKASKSTQQQGQQGKKQDLEQFKHLFGTLPLIQSTERTGKKFARVQDLDETMDKQTVTIRARVHNVRGKGNLCFLVLRQNFSTVQAIFVKGEENPKEMVTFAAGLGKETIVDLEGVVTVAQEKIVATTQQSVEIAARKIFIVSLAEQLPMQIEDAARPKSILKAQDKEIELLEQKIRSVQEKRQGLTPDSEEDTKLKAEEAELVKQKSAAQKYVKVSRETRLDNRVLDLRTPANQAVFRVQSAVCQLFRENLLSQGFTEIHSPKMIGCASEGGANVFKLKYFEGWAFLAQSPQLYKQMSICADMDRVFEVGPVFRAENSNTHRHLTEFVGLDLEMSFYEHYHEVLDVLDALFISIFDGLTKRFSAELEAIRSQYPFEPLKYSFPSLRLKYSEGVAMLREAGVTMDDQEDLSTENEKFLGRLVKQKYDTDFYMLDKFPLAIRPFYTMPDPTDARWSNSYDFFIRGEEILSGAQRIHDPDLLLQRANACGVGIEGIKDYVDSFRFGALPHGGGGIGMERVVMLYLGLSNIRMTSLFPRDPSRLTP